MTITSLTHSDWLLLRRIVEARCQHLLKCLEVENTVTADKQQLEAMREAANEELLHSGFRADYTATESGHAIERLIDTLFSG